MNGGNIKCAECGQEQYVETVRTYFNCIQCGNKHDVNPIPKPEEQTKKEETSQ